MHVSLRLAAVVVVAILHAGSAAAEDFPSRTIRIIVGPSPDAIPRVFAERMQKQWGTPVIVEPRPGAGGDIAAKAVAGADADGYTLLNATSSFTLNTAMGSASYDFVKDFEPIALINLSSFVLVANKSLPVDSVQDLIALAKQKPGRLNCGSAGIGTPPHLACEVFKRLAGVDIVHVPFREANASITALLGGHVELSFALSAAARGQIEAGAVKALAVTTTTRSRLFPSLPTLQEAGLEGFEVTGWGSFVAPAGTPKPAIEKLNVEVLRELRDPEVQQALGRMNLDLPPLYRPAQVGDFVRADVARWNRIIDTAGVARAQGTK